MSTSAKVPDWEDYRNHLDHIRDQALAAVNPEHLIKSCLSIKSDQLYVLDNAHSLDPEGKIFLAGAGKAGFAMSRAAMGVLGNRIKSGVIAVPVLPEEPTGEIEYILGGHPLPTEGSIRAGNKIQTLLQSMTEKDTVIILISGGGSALVELPETGIVLEDLRRINELLLKSGATIHEVNLVRRQLSMIKGGGLTRMAAPAKVIALILSDVIGDHLSDIASGLTVNDPTTAEEALMVIDKYRLSQLVPENILSILRRKLGSSPSFEFDDRGTAHNYIAGNNQIASQAAKNAAEALGFQTVVVTTQMQGEAALVGKNIGALLKILRHVVRKGNRPIALIFGGETTVIVRAEGIGGRNQELALSATLELSKLRNIALMTLATDGVDGPTPAAGAVVTGETASKAHAQGLNAAEYLARNDSHSFFTQLGDTIITGPTGTNVNDLVIALIY